LRSYLIKFVIISFIAISTCAQPQILQNIRTITPSEKYVVTNWNSSSGLPQNSINRIVQDKNGYIWVSTYGGLVRFDGFSFKTYTASEFPVLQSDRINSLFLDSNNQLWISNELGKLIIFDGKTFTDITNKFSDSHLNIFQFAEDSKGNFYLCSTNRDLFYYSNGTATKINYLQNGKPIKDFYYISFSYKTKNDTLFAIFENQAALFYNGKIVKQKSISLPFGFHNHCVYNENGIWILYGQRIYYAKSFEDIENPINLFPDRLISTIFMKDSSILAGTDDGAVVLIKNNSLETIIPKGKISTTVYSRVFIDSENNYWVGTQLHGLYLIRKRFIYTLDKTFGIDELNTYPILNSSDGTIWIGQNPGIQKIVNNRELITPFEKMQRTKAKIIAWAITEDKNKNIWIGANGNGILKATGDKLEEYLDRDSLRQKVNSNFFSAFTDKSGRIWFGSVGAVVINENGKFRVHYPEQSKRNNYRHFFQDEKGIVWIASDEGLFKYENEKFQFIKEANAKSARALYIDKKKRLWVGTYGNGLRIKLKDRFVTITKKNGLFNDIISAIVEDGKGNFWFTCNNGIFRIRETEIDNYLDGKKDFLISINYGSEEGLANIEFNGGCQPSWMRDYEGNLWFPSFGGPVVLDLNSFKDLVTKPKVFVESLSLKDTTFYTGDNIVLPSDYTNLTIRFNSPSFASPQNVRFRYRLLGLEDEWHNIDGRRDISYQKLPYGNYEFQILASDSYGNWSVTPASLKFKVDSIFWETPAFYILVSMSAIIGILLLYYSRMQTAEKEHIKLEKIIEERTQSYKIAKIEAEKAAIEEKILRDKSEEENRQKVEILRIVSHDLKNPVFAVKGFSEILLEDSELNQDERNLVKMIGEAGERMQDLITQLLNFSRFEGQNFSLDKTVFNVIDEINKVIDRVEHHAQKKQQTIVKDYKADNRFIFADNVLFTQIIENLLTNAIKYSEQNKKIIVGVKESGNNIVIFIQDFGQGFSQEDIKNLYKPFVKLSSIPTAGEASSGLGLAIVKRFVELNEGKIRLDSQKGSGSVFTIEFKLAK
jgi:signal transduction histidine kinase/ligand-binding sensor domain-containing protein